MNTIAISLVVILILFTIALSIFSRRFTRTTADFYLAGRKVGSFTNASAISGDYLSAASFLGVAGAVYASGLDGVWYAAGFAGGFMVVVLFIASALRRFGEYTVADFAFGRFGTSRIRLLTVLAVLLTSLFYMAPQMFGAGTTWQVLVGTGIFGMDPYTSGVVVVTLDHDVLRGRRRHEGHHAQPDVPVLVAVVRHVPGRHLRLRQRLQLPRRAAAGQLRRPTAPARSSSPPRP